MLNSSAGGWHGLWECSIGKLTVYGLVNGFREVIAQLANMPCVGGSDDLAAERGMDMERANARLIAAAPEMYEALKALFEKGYCEGGSYASQDFVPKSAIAKCRSILARVEADK